MAYITNRGRNARALQFYNSIGKNIIGSKQKDTEVDASNKRAVFNYYLGLMCSSDAAPRMSNVLVLAKMCCGSIFGESGNISGNIKLVTNEDITSNSEIYGGSALSFQGETWYTLNENAILMDNSKTMNPDVESTAGSSFTPRQIYIYYEGYIDLAEVKKKGFTDSGDKSKLLSVAVLSNVEFKTTPASWAAAPAYASIDEVAEIPDGNKKAYIEASQLITPVVMAAGITGRQRIAFLMQF